MICYRNRNPLGKKRIDPKLPGRQWLYRERKRRKKICVRCTAAVHTEGKRIFALCLPHMRDRFERKKKLRVNRAVEKLSRGEKLRHDDNVDTTGDFEFGDLVEAPTTVS